MTGITMKQRFGRAALVGIAGGAVAWAIMIADNTFRADYSFLRAAIMGAFLAGLIVARGFGGRGARGWFMAGLSFALATVLGAIFAVPLIFLDDAFVPKDLLRTFGEVAGMILLGPLYVGGLMGGKLLVLKAWLAVCILVHFVVIGDSMRRRPWG